eukprot:222929-Pelagomonas_calceolata.AAC.5
MPTCNTTMREPTTGAAAMPGTAAGAPGMPRGAAGRAAAPALPAGCVVIRGGGGCAFLGGEEEGQAVSWMPKG